MEEKYIVAVEIGSSKIKGALGVIDAAGILNVIAVQEERLADSVRYGQIRNVEEVSNKIDAIRRKLENCKSVMPRKISGVYVGLSGCTVASTAVEVSSSLPGEVEITTQTIDELKEKAAASVFSDKDIYEIVPKEYFVDNMSTLNPVGTFGSSVRGEFTLISGAPGLKSNINRVFPERLQLKVCGYVVSATAQADSVLTDDEKRLGSMFVDFGAETTTVLLYKAGVLQYLATLPMGSRNITRDLVSLNYLEERAEAIKRSVGVASAVGGGQVRSSSVDMIDQPEINNYIQARAGEIVANVLVQIEYAGLKTADLPAGIVIVGGGARLKGFSEMLAGQSRMKVRMGMSPRGVRISDSAIQADDAVDVISLLCQAAKNSPQECLSASVSPVASDDRFHHEDRRQLSEEEYYDRHEPAVRIGMDEDEDILEDDDDDKYIGRGNSDVRHRRKEPSVESPRKEKGPSIIERIRGKLVNLLNDPEDDRFEEDDPQQDNERR